MKLKSNPDLIKKLYEKGKTVQEISDITGTAPSSVYYALNLRKTKMRTCGASVVHRQKRLEEVKDKDFAKDYKAGVNIPTLARKYKMSTGMARHLLNELGVELRQNATLR